MPDSFTLFTIVFVAIAGFFLYRYLKAGSLIGAMLGGRVRETVGEAILASSRGSSTVLRVQLLEGSAGAEPFVALSITRRAPLGASVTPLRLSLAQAREVGELLGRAGRAG